MPDFKQFLITDLADASVTVNRFAVAVLVTNSQTGATIADFTGANRLVFPAVLGTLTAAQRRQVMERMVHDVIRIKAGL